MDTRLSSCLLFVVNLPIFLCPVRNTLQFLCQTKLSHISVLYWEVLFQPHTWGWGNGNIVLTFVKSGYSGTIKVTVTMYF